MTRAVSHLCIIYRFKINYRSYPTKLPNMKVNNNFINCQKVFKRNDVKYECSKCNINQICVACLFGCHNDHQTKVKGFVYNENEKCNCSNYKYLIKRK